MTWIDFAVSTVVMPDEEQMLSFNNDTYSKSILNYKKNSR